MQTFRNCHLTKSFVHRLDDTLRNTKQNPDWDHHLPKNPQLSRIGENLHAPSQNGILAEQRIETLGKKIMRKHRSENALDLPPGNVTLKTNRHNITTLENKQFLADWTRYPKSTPQCSGDTQKPTTSLAKHAVSIAQRLSKCTTQSSGEWVKKRDNDGMLR